MGVGRAGLQATIVKRPARDNQLKLNSHIARKQKAWRNTDFCSLDNILLLGFCALAFLIVCKLSEGARRAILGILSWTAACNQSGSEVFDIEAWQNLIIEDGILYDIDVVLSADAEYFVNHAAAEGSTI